MKRKSARSLSLLTAVLMLLCIQPFQVFAEGSGNVRPAGDPVIWDGSIAESFAGGTGTEDDPFIISTAAQLAYLAQETNNGNQFQDVYFKLTDDIYLNDTTDWENWGKVNGVSLLDCFYGDTEAASENIHDELPHIQILDEADADKADSYNDLRSSVYLPAFHGMAAPNALSLAMNAPGQKNVITSTDNTWVADNTSFEGLNVGASHNQGMHDTTAAASASVTLHANDIISFDYRVSCEIYWDAFHFYINGAEILVDWGEKDWTSFTHIVTETEAGAAILSWEYSKDDRGSKGADTAWVDNVCIGSDTSVTGISLPETFSVSLNNPDQIDYTVLPEGTRNTAVNFESADPSVAVVDEFGVVTGISLGETVITATTGDGGFTDTCNVTIYNQSVEGVTIEPAEAQVGISRSMKLNAVFIPENASNKNITWTVDNPEVLSVDENGVITGISEGTAVVTVTTQEGGFTATARIDVCPVPVEGITLASLEFNVISLGRSKQFTASVTPDYATNKNILWSVSDESIISVDSEGIVTGLAEGKAAVTATTEDGGFSASADVYVCSAPANDWTAIGIDNDLHLRFRGHFEGCGHTVYGMYLNEPGNDYRGLFGWLWGTVSNLGVERNFVCCSYFPAGVAAFAGVPSSSKDKTSITNCYNTGNICALKRNAGGVAATSQDGILIGCYNTGDITSAEGYVGGVVAATITGVGMVKDCYNSGSILSLSGPYAGGVMDLAKNPVINCYNIGNIEAKASKYVGGIAGFSQKTMIHNCCNLADVSADNQVGGITGYAQSVDISYCRNSGQVSCDGVASEGFGYVGGIAGFISGMFSGSNASYCWNGGDVSGTSVVGGIVGYLQGNYFGYDNLLHDCYNAGSVMGNTVVGGAAGKVDQQITHCYNVGAVTGEDQAGALAMYKSDIGSAAECYYLDGCCEQGDEYALPLTDEKLRAAENYAGFDFEAVWTMEGDPSYPYAELVANIHVGNNLNGDYDCNGIVNAQDVILTLRAAMELITPSEQSLLNADMDGDGRLTAADALTILRIAMNLL